MLVYKRVDGHPFNLVPLDPWAPLVELAQSIDFEKFKPVMLAALRSLLLGAYGFRLSVMRPQIV